MLPLWLLAAIAGVVVSVGGAAALLIIVACHHVRSRANAGSVKVSKSGVVLKELPPTSGSPDHPNVWLLLIYAALTGRVSGKLKPSFELPPPSKLRVAARQRVTLTADAVRAFRAVCGYGPEVIPSQQVPMMFTAVAAEAMALNTLITDARFPFPVVPFPIHVGQTVEAHGAPLMVGDTVTMSIRVLEVIKSERGIEVAIVATMTLGREMRIRSVTRGLYRFAKPRGPRPRPSASLFPGDTREIDGTRVGQTYTLSQAKRYAEASGDHNPIHVIPYLAKVFGFKAAIAHGMLTMTRCIKALREQGSMPSGSCAVEVTFKRPILLPTETTFRQVEPAEGTSGARFEVASPRKGGGRDVHLTGHVIELSGPPPAVPTFDLDEAEPPMPDAALDMAAASGQDGTQEAARS